MNILLAAYEFPPSGSPQAMRWSELSRQLAALGHCVTVLTAVGTVMSPDAVREGDDVDPPGVKVVRTPALPASRLLAWARRVVLPERMRGAGPVIIPRSFEGLNWKGRIVATIGWAQAWASFPDLRGRWNLTAGPAIESLLRTLRPDVVITSHEPASVLELGRAAVRAGIPWVADLGDPVDADYLPARWRRRARRLEREVCSRCSLVSVTTKAYARRLEVQHGLDPARSIVLRQGFSPRASSSRESRGLPGETLELLYTGQLYGFRSPVALLEALGTVDGVRLTLLSPQASLAGPFAQRLGSRLRALPPVPRGEVADWQRGADILVNIGNTMPLQVPGKLFEYFGSGRPVLHITACDSDESSDLVGGLRRGWVVDNDAGAIRGKLLELLAQWRRGSLHAGLDLSKESVDEFSWPTIGARLSDALAEAVEHGPRRMQA
ncbi:glycosyltransferase [Lysobacter sp. A3-1-A15]|uniref:glycosyltransferase n=1 Tax=Novilysobacter viscosus TaxID=3098602 RepID=UPI002EDB5074